MSLWLYLPVLLTATFGVAAPAASRTLPPAVATWLLSTGALVAAAASSACLALLAFVLVAQAPVLATRGRWSNEVLRLREPVATPIAMLATLAILVCALRFLSAAIRRTAAVRSAYRLAAALPQSGGELAVLDTADLQAFAVPGRPGRIVVTTALLRSLDGPERRAVLAHERAHLRHRHHVHQSAAHLAAAVNPFLGRLPAAIELSCERWADEAAASVGPRDTVADALMHAAAGATLSTPEVVLAAAAADVIARVGALRGPAPRLTLWPVVLLLALLAATTAAVAMAMHDTEQLFELAQHAYRAGRR